MRATIVWILALGCSGAGQDIDSPTLTGGEEDSDIAGSYEAELQGAAGCEASAPPDFVTGALEVSGPDSALVFVFEDGTELSGSMDAFTVSLSGEVGAVSVEGEGLAYLDAGRWVLEIDLDMQAADCVRTGLLKATQTEVAQ